MSALLVERNPSCAITHFRIQPQTPGRREKPAFRNDLMLIYRKFLTDLYWTLVQYSPDDLPPGWSVRENAGRKISDSES
ncbi:MAG TPA: hypothetical protein VF452_18615, partial [Candidatus Binatia bacterium]